MWHGRDAVAPVLREQFDSVFRMVRLELAEMVRGPGGWLVGGRVFASHDSGMNLDWTSYAVAQFEGDLVKRVWVFADRESAARQAGLEMSDEEVIRAAVDAWNERGVEAFLEYVAPGIEWRMPAGFPQGDLWRGRDELRRELHDQFSDLFTPGTVDVKSIESVPEGSLVAVRHSVEARASGMDLWWDAWYVWTVEDGLITRSLVFLNQKAAMRAAEAGACSLAGDAADDRARDPEREAAQREARDRAGAADDAGPALVAAKLDVEPDRQLPRPCPAGERGQGRAQQRRQPRERKLAHLGRGRAPPEGEAVQVVLLAPGDRDSFREERANLGKSKPHVHLVEPVELLERLALDVVDRDVDLPGLHLELVPVVEQQAHRGHRLDVDRRRCRRPW